MERDFSTISPSARSIILMKGYTTIPFARQTAELISRPDKFLPDFDKKDFMFWAKVMHFETRYLAINQLLAGLGIGNYLELSSGYSFRCLELAKDPATFYIDTDLPEVIEKKREMLGTINKSAVPGKIELLPLNALDEEGFRRTVSLLPPGRIAIINEGLLIYLDQAEKERLCRIIHSVLEERGGYWITSDIYVRAGDQGQGQGQGKKADKELNDFSERHNIEENKFSSFEEAKAFFSDMGFAVDQEESIDVTQLSSFAHFAKNMGSSPKEPPRRSGKLQTSWRLKIAP